MKKVEPQATIFMPKVPPQKPEILKEEDKQRIKIYWVSKTLEADGVTRKTSYARIRKKFWLNIPLLKQMYTEVSMVSDDQIVHSIPGLFYDGVVEFYIQWCNSCDLWSSKADESKESNGTDDSDASKNSNRSKIPYELLKRIASFSASEYYNAMHFMSYFCDEMKLNVFLHGGMKFPDNTKECLETIKACDPPLRGKIYNHYTKICLQLCDHYLIKNKTCKLWVILGRCPIIADYFWSKDVDNILLLVGVSTKDYKAYKKLDFQGVVTYLKYLDNLVEMVEMCPFDEWNRGSFFRELPLTKQEITEEHIQFIENRKQAHELLKTLRDEEQFLFLSVQRLRAGNLGNLKKEETLLKQKKEEVAKQEKFINDNKFNF